MNRRARQAFARLRDGMEYPSWFVTLTRGHCLDLTLRPDAWHRVLTRLRERWPDVQACTVYEYGLKRRGVHLHVIIRRAPDLTQGWLDHIMVLQGDGTEAHLEPTEENSESLARYLTKQLADPDSRDQWPPRSHRFSFTRGWCPDWVPDRPSSAAARRPALHRCKNTAPAAVKVTDDGGTPHDDAATETGKRPRRSSR